MAFKINGSTVISDALAITAPNLQVDDTTLFVDATNNRVGVGTITPATTLDVNGDVTIADRIIHSGDTNTAIRFPAADTMTVETSGSERIRIDSTGNVGIGTISPVIRTHIQNSDAGTNTVLDVLRLDRQTSGTPAIGIGVGMEFAVETSANNTEIGAIIEAVTTGVTAAAENFDLVFRTMSAGAAAAERVRIASDGTLTVRGNILPEANNTRNIGSATFKYNTMYATLFSGTAVEAYYADLAEIYETDNEYEPGTLVEFGGEKEVTITSTEFTTKIAGVISTNPAYLMNNEAAGQPIALKGRVPCKVVGPVKAGDFIVSSNIPGVGKASDTWIGGAVIGKVIKNDDSESVRLVEVVVGVM